MTLRDLMARHARGPLTRTDHFGETVSFRPKGGTAVDVTVVVDRSQRLDQISDNRSMAGALSALVFVPRGSTVVKIAAGDQMDVAIDDEGGTVVRCRIDEVMASDPGGWLVRVQK